MNNPPFAWIAGLLLMILWACASADEIGVATPGVWNLHTRLDRLPLTPEQRPDRLDAGDLRRGTYRTAPDQIISEAWPESMTDVAPAHPQSTCFWLAHEGINQEAMRLHWEQVMELSNDNLDDLGYDHAINQLSFCRFNDPVTRQYPRKANGDTRYKDLQPSQFTNDNSGTTCWDSSGSVPRLLEDFNMFWGRLYEFPSAVDAFNTCTLPDLSDTGSAVELTENVRGFTGPFSRQGASTSCSGPMGKTVFPERDGAMVLTHYWEMMDSRMLLPATKLAASGETLARPLARSNDELFWTTPHSGNSSVDVHWEESFSRRIKTQTVRFFTLESGVRRYLDTGGEPLCITDPLSGSSCRWTCEAVNGAAGSVYPVTAASAGAGGCRLASTGTADHPAVTPTYAKDKLCDPSADSACQALIEPLRWSLLETFAGSGGELYIEFEIEPVFEEMSLRVSPGYQNMGQTRVGKKRQANFEIRNTGGVAVKVDTLYLDLHSESVVTGSAKVLHGERAHALPFSYEGGPLELELKGGLEHPGFRSRLGETHTLMQRLPLDGETLLVGEATARVEGQFLIRDRLEDQLEFPQAAGQDFPLHVSSFAEKRLPFVLMPDQRALVLVSLTADAYHGVDGSNEHRGWLHVEASNVDDPVQRQTSRTPISIHALMGPSLEVMPRALSLPLPGGADSARRSAAILLTNPGDVGLELKSLKFLGRDAGRFDLDSWPTLPLLLNPGDGHVLRLDYDGACDQHAWQGHRATLEMVTGEQLISYPLGGAADCTVALP